MKTEDLRVGDTVVVRLDGRERRARVTAFPRLAATGARSVGRVRVELESGASIVVAPVSIRRREGRGAFAHGRKRRRRPPQEREIAP